MRTIKMYTASWCGSCRVLKPQILELAKPEKVKVEIISQEENSDEFIKNDIKGLPTVVVLDENKNVLNRQTGSVSVKLVKQFLEG